MSIPVGNYSKIAFSTSFNYENVVIKGTTVGTIGAGAFSLGSVNIAHNLGYIPFYRVFVQFPGDTKIYAASTGPGTNGLVGDFEIVTVNADDTYLNVGVSRDSAGGGDFTVYYRIYKEQRGV